MYRKSSSREVFHPRVKEIGNSICEVLTRKQQKYRDIAPSKCNEQILGSMSLLNFLSARLDKTPTSYAPLKSKLQHPLSSGKSRAFDYLLYLGSGEFDG